MAKRRPPRPPKKPARPERVTVSSLLGDSGSKGSASGVTLDPALRRAGLIPGVNIGTRPPKGTLRTVAPQILLPMRLEYRVVTATARPEVANIDDDLRAFKRLTARFPGKTTAARRALEAARIGLKQAITTKALATKGLTIAGKTEIWFRFYPDGNFVRKGIHSVSDAERASLRAFRTRVGARAPFDLSDSETAAAWAELAGTIGAYRALEVLRRPEADFGADSTPVAGRIVALPQSVSLYAIHGSDVRLLATGSPIPPNTDVARSPVSYTPEATEPGGWMRDFPIAIANGMGVRLTDAPAVDAALAADAIVAVGRHGEGTDDISQLVRDGIAHGTFAFVPQDTPTNNGPNAPTNLGDPLSDLPGFLAEAAMDEQGTLPADGSAADLLASALDLDRAMLHKAIQAGDRGFDDAKAMLRVIGPALLDGSLDGVTAVDNVDENTFVEILGAAFAARGALAAVRIGSDPYGVLPVADLAALDTADPDAKAQAVHAFLSAYVNAVRAFVTPMAGRTVSVLAPDDPHAAAKLEDILKNNRVSTRIVVADESDTGTTPIGCPYVTGSRPQDKPETYLRDLASKPISSLPDPTDAEPFAPLLYRLARLSLSGNVSQIVLEATRLTERRVSGPRRRLSTRLETDAALRRTLDGSGLLGRSVAEMAGPAFSSTLGVGPTRHLHQIQKSFADALARLEAIARGPQGTARLEMLLMEVIDLFQHRVDAWATGLAYQQLVKLRKNGVAGLGAGYYGYLGKLRAAAAPGQSNGYIQAPSMAQATTAAILRSAFLRHAGQGAFEIDLSSRRVRRALRLLDVLRKGIAIEEAFGLRGERWLHDNKLSRLTLEIRATFPFVNPAAPDAGDGGGDAAIRVFDGLAFLDGSLDSFAPDDRVLLAQLKRVLAEDLDALSDIVVAEAAHQRAMGQSGAAKAWLNVLSGGTVPGTPSFLRTHRIGQGSTYRVSFAFPVSAAPAAATPREIAEPTLAAVANAAFANFAATRAQVTIDRVDDPSKRHSFSVALAGDLGMHPLDLVIGGQSELEVRIRHQAVSLWLRAPEFRDALGGIAPKGLRSFVDGKAKINVTDTATGPRLSVALGRALKLRTLVQRSRPLEPSDFNAAATPGAPLDEATEIALVATGVGALTARVGALKTRLDAARSALANARAAFLQAIRSIRQALDAPTPLPVTVTQLLVAEAGRQNLEEARVAVAAFNEPAALRQFTLEEAIADPDRCEEAILGIEARVSSKSEGLAAVLVQTSGTSPQRLEEARGSRRALSRALQAALDGDALPILTPFARVPSTTPLVDAPAAVPAALSPWPGVRRTVALAVDVAAALPGIRAHPVSAAATAADTTSENRDPRSEAEAPVSRHFGVIVAAPQTLSQAAYVGFVADEWTEQRPSINQPAALAVNYDAPGAEAPNCLLLCVPSRAGQTQWTDQSLVSLVRDAFSWAKIRALSTDQKLWPAAFLPKADQVPTKDAKRRIPRSLRHFLDVAATFEGAFAVMADAGEASFGAAKAVWNERSGFSGTKE